MDADIKILCSKWQLSKCFDENGNLLDGSIEAACNACLNQWPTEITNNFENTLRQTFLEHMGKRNFQRLSPPIPPKNKTLDVQEWIISENYHQRTNEDIALAAWFFLKCQRDLNFCF